MNSASEDAKYCMFEEDVRIMRMKKEKMIKMKKEKKYIFTNIG